MKDGIIKEPSSKRTYLEAIIVCGLLIGGFFFGGLALMDLVKLQSSPDLDFTIYRPPIIIHTTITMFKDGIKVFEEYHAGTMTKYGYNVTFAKLVGNSTMYNMTQYNMNASYIGIGDQGTLNTDSTVLPGEWNRTSVSSHDGTYNSCNFTATFIVYGASYTADCISLNIQSGIGQAYSMIGYDTFTEVTGIGASGTWTVVVEMKLVQT